MDERSLRIQRAFEWPMVIVALLTIPALVIEESSYGTPWTTIAAALNWVIWLAFLTELVVMLSVVPDRRAWLRERPLDPVIVFLTPPILPPGLQAARVLRLFRVAALFRARDLGRLLSLQGIRYAGLLVALVVVAGGTAFAEIEGRGLSAWDGIWFAIVTVTTVGYGEVAPTTTAGRLVAVVIMFTGIGFVALLTAYTADRFVNRQRKAADSPDVEVLKQLHQISERLDRIERGRDS